MSKSFTLVTGAAGFIGSNLTRELLQKGKSVIAIDSFLPNLYSVKVKEQRWKALQDLGNSQLVLLNFDLRTDDFVKLKKYDIGTIFNEAAMPGLISNWSEANIYFECNLIALQRLLEFAKELDLNAFVQASTSSVYGKDATGDEKAITNPTSPYGVSKLAAEKLILAYKEWFGLHAVILRYFSVYGPGQRPDMAFAKLIQAALTGDEFTIFGDGSQMRSNTYIDDIISATILADSRTVSGEILNVCGDETISLNQVIEAIEQFTSKKIKLVRREVRIGDQRKTSGDNTKIKSLLNWGCKVDFNQGIKKQIDSAI